ncbi:hypothetical protein ACH5RR_006182 [Cinchona calisaya]|uniref:Uncharacterized protein n=1 Tax=Cinchona calisaya TaxID=153742 RepID=A0ABD3ANA5_9GENT
MMMGNPIVPGSVTWMILDEMPKLAQEKGNSAQHLNDVLVDNLMTHGVAKDSHGVDNVQGKSVNELSNTLNIGGDYREHSSIEALDILKHIFDELSEVPSKVVSSLREPLDLECLQDDLDMRPKPTQSIFAGRPLIGGASSSKVRVNMCRTTGPSTIVLSERPQVHRAREHHLEQKKSIGS